MKPIEFLHEMLREQTLSEDSTELAALRERRDEVEKVLRDVFGSSPTIRYGGSRAKSDLIKDSYDLDIVCYFPRDDKDAGDTLKTIYENVEKALSKDWNVERKTSALRIRGKDQIDFHIDVVPGRFIDEKTYDTFLYRASGEKERLRTNIEKHIDHVKKSGVIDAIKLVKLWRNRNGLTLKTFALELLVIKILKTSERDLDEQLKTVLTILADDQNAISIEDPANPWGNDLSEIWNSSIYSVISIAAKNALSILQTHGWESVLGQLTMPEGPSKMDALRRVASTSTSRSKPWCHG